MMNSAPMEQTRREIFLDAVKQFQSDMLRLARRLCIRNEDCAQDLVQEAVVRAYTALTKGQFVVEGNARAYLLRTLTNLFINERRRAKFDAGVNVETLTAGGEVGPEVTRSNPMETPHRALLEHTFDEPLERALLSLPDDLRACVLLVDVEEMSYQEAADALRVPVGTVRSRLSRARYRLQDILRDYAKERRLT